MLDLSVRGCSLPKDGHAPAEVEDAWSAAPEQGRFAVSDGASESAFAGTWARLLAEGFVANRSRWSEWLPDAQRRWHEQFAGQELPWYAETKFQEGAYATLLGLKIGIPNDDGSRDWQAWAVGDSCLMHLRGPELLTAFPVASSQDFGNAPDLVCSRRLAGPRRPTRRLRTRGLFLSGDCLFLMTDALAQFFLAAHERGERPGEILVNALEDFPGWVARQRAAKTMRNDDVTLVVVTG